MMQLTDHASKRLRQRAMSPFDVELIVAHGTPVRDGYLLRERDVSERVSELKEEINNLERLKNRVVIADGNAVITAYPPSKRKRKRLLMVSEGK